MSYSKCSVKPRELRKTKISDQYEWARVGIDSLRRISRALQCSQVVSCSLVLGETCDCVLLRSINCRFKITDRSPDVWRDDRRPWRGLVLPGAQKELHCLLLNEQQALVRHLPFAMCRATRKFSVLFGANRHCHSVVHRVDRFRCCDRPYLITKAI